MPKMKSFQLIHTQIAKKRGKKKIFQKLSTLSTQNYPIYVDYSDTKKNECFGEL